MGSTVHSVAGDTTGIVLAAVITALVGLPMWLDLIVEYTTGFLFGLLIFQTLFMRKIPDAKSRAYAITFSAEGDSGTRLGFLFFVRLPGTVQTGADGLKSISLISIPATSLIRWPVNSAKLQSQRGHARSWHIGVPNHAFASR